MDWEAQDEGVIAKILAADGTKDIPVGTVVAVVVEDAEHVRAPGLLLHLNAIKSNPLPSTYLQTLLQASSSCCKVEGFTLCEGSGNGELLSISFVQKQPRTTTIDSRHMGFPSPTIAVLCCFH